LDDPDLAGIDPLLPPLTGEPGAVLKLLVKVPKRHLRDRLIDDFVMIVHVFLLGFGATWSVMTSPVASFASLDY
jgi:hypothetical protein